MALVAVQISTPANFKNNKQKLISKLSITEVTSKVLSSKCLIKPVFDVRAKNICARANIYIFVFERSWSYIDTPLLLSGKVVAMQSFTAVTEWQRAG